jgi:two-component system nitrogen regulation sensor histidine kinase GlnL
LAKGHFKAALPADSPLIRLLDRAVAEDGPVREHGIEISLFGHPPFLADGATTPMGDGSVLLTLHLRGGAVSFDRAADASGLRSVVGLGQMLAHEIKNPLAGIRGAAQLLKSGAAAEDAPLAQLIVDETERIRRLVDRMEAFSDEVLPQRSAVNIHEVLDRVRALAANGVADGLALRENYDPSLPPVSGDEDHLIQIFLNLVKNAAEAAHGRRDGRDEGRSGAVRPTAAQLRPLKRGTVILEWLMEEWWLAKVTRVPTRGGSGGKGGKGGKGGNGGGHGSDD